MFKKVNIFLILFVLLISITAVSAVDDVNDTLNTNEVDLDNLELSDYSDTLSLSEESNDNSDVLQASPTKITSNDYGKYFDKEGNYIGSASDIQLSGKFSDKVFIFNKTVTVTGNSNSMSDSMITVLSGASNSSFSNLKITNTKDVTYGIFLNSASNCVIKGCTINNTGASSYDICLGNGAKYNKILDNKLYTYGITYGHNTRSTPPLVLSGSDYNEIAGNKFIIDDANAIYLSTYAGGPLTGGTSNYNNIHDNTIKYNVIPTSWSYGIQVMGNNNKIIKNNITGAYRGISASGEYNNISNNNIVDLTGAHYGNRSVVVGGEFGIIGGSNAYIYKNIISNAKIISSGAGISVGDNSVVDSNEITVVFNGMGVEAAGLDITIKNNIISTENGVGVHQKLEASGLTITGNTIKTNNGIPILIEKSGRSMPSDVTVTDNDISSNSSIKIDVSGVDKSSKNTIARNKNIKTGKIINQDSEYKKPAGVISTSIDYNYNNKTHKITSENIREYIDYNGNLIGVEDKDTIIFSGKFYDEVIQVSKQIKIVGDDAYFYNSTFKVTSGGVWIENLNIVNDNAKRVNAWGIYVNEAAGVKIINNKINVSDPNAAYAVYVLESSYVEVRGNTLSSSGDYLTFTLLSYSSDDCVFEDNTIYTRGTGKIYNFVDENSIEGSVFENLNYTINGTELCIDGVTYRLDAGELCIDGKTYTINENNELCIDGNVYTTSVNNEVCIDGKTYTVMNNEVCIDGKPYSIKNGELCIDGNTYSIKGSELCIDGKTYSSDNLPNGITYSSKNKEICIDGRTYCLDGNELCIDGKTYSVKNNQLCIDGATYSIKDNELCIDGKTYCLDGGEVCIDGKTYCLDGNELCVDGVTYCLDGNELCIDGKTYSTSHIVPEIFRTYGILLLYSSQNYVSKNTVTVTSKVSETHTPFNSQNSIVGIDAYYNSHNNTFSKNKVTVKAKDNYLYGMGVLGYRTGHSASERQGATNNKFIENIIDLEGTYFTEGIVIGSSSYDTLLENNVVTLKSQVAYGVNLELSQRSTIKNNNLTLNSDVAYGIEAVTSDKNIIEGNNIVATAKQSRGIALSGSNNEVTKNIINSNGNGNSVDFKNLDSMGYGNAGVYIVGNSTNNRINDNKITSKKGYAVELNSAGNIVEDNYLKSEKGNSDKGVNNNKGNVVKDNYIYVATQTTSLKIIEVPYSQTGSVTLTFVSDGGSVNDKLVDLYWDNVKIASGKIANGKVTINFKLPKDDEVSGATIYPQAIFNGSGFKASVTTIPIKIIQDTPKITVNSISVKPGLKAPYTATVTDSSGNPVSGLNVSFGRGIGSAITNANGVAIVNKVLDKSYSAVQSDDIKVTFSGSTNYKAATGTGKLTVLKIAKTTINLKKKLSLKSVLATVVDNNGFAIAKMKVAMTIDGKKYSATTDSKGQIKLPSAIKAGTHKVTLKTTKTTYYSAGSAKYNKVVVVKPITGNKNVKTYYGSTATYKIRFYDANGVKLAQGKKVSIKVNGKSVSRTVDKNGYISYSVKKIGTYTIKATYNGYSVSNKLVIKPTLTASNVVKKKAKTIKFTVKLVNKNGKILKNKKITIKVKNKKYTAITNKKGIATLSLKNLKVGTYKVTSSYGGCTIKNTIKIKK
ncbi:MAG: right-handed parallel beta-helix repeat-containing protein [Methanobrevibacter sp.]|uniref:right-handed parallel beta-helix repeat-containing protein n=1 Tax=Methanobrevibacter sp. TaxID=66852 RepID=UPI0025EE7A0A|nr:right-handed parallel beta-helix repeat-containing protein [Methanobrevibacter sp.]MBR3113587.1 right-handed parallel beta-helix repeat-containing protein [Methanobrevibacter sp.]